MLNRIYLRILWLSGRYYRIFKEIRHGAVVKRGIFFGPKFISIGEYCYVGPEAYWQGTGGIEIGAGTIFGPRSAIWTINHEYRFAQYVPYGTGIKKKSVVVGKGCWFGLNVMIAPGVSIGDGVIAAMGSVILADVPPHSIVAGNPAVIVRNRSDDELEYQALKQAIAEERWYMRSKNAKKI